jgi:hypothetical protein
VPARDSDPLEAFRKEIEKRRKSRRRTNKVAYSLIDMNKKRYSTIGLTCARLWSELSYEKRRVFFNRELTIMKRDKINRRYYHKYKGVLGVNAGQVVNKND